MGGTSNRLCDLFCGGFGLVLFNVVAVCPNFVASD